LEEVYYSALTISIAYISQATTSTLSE